MCLCLHDYDSLSWLTGTRDKERGMLDTCLVCLTWWKIVRTNIWTLCIRTKVLKWTKPCSETLSFDDRKWLVWISGCLVSMCMTVVFILTGRSERGDDWKTSCWEWEDLSGSFPNSSDEPRPVLEVRIDCCFTRQEAAAADCRFHRCRCVFSRAGGIRLPTSGGIWLAQPQCDSSMETPDGC